MNKKGENKSKAWIVIVLLIAGVIAYFYFTGSAIKTVNEHKVPADLSKNEQGTGMSVRFVDSNGNPINIPDWFSASPKAEDYSIVSHSNVPCTISSDCAGYSSDPTHIMCWGTPGKCVLGNVAGIYIDFIVTNPLTSEITFLNVQPVSATPTAFSNALNRTIKASLIPGETYKWTMPVAIGTSQFEAVGSQTFTTSVVGKNAYTGLNNTVTDQITFGFVRDPVGGLTVGIQSAF